jgi:hypothetical protein
LVIFDEVTCAPHSTQAALLRIVNERCVGSVRLPDRTSFVLIGNPADTAAGGFDLAPSTANRDFHLYWELDHETWATWMLTSECSAEEREQRARIVAFTQFRPNLLCLVPEEETLRSGPWPSHRTWTMAAKLEALAPEEPGEMMRGCVGDGPTIEYVSWIKNQDLPSPESILENPSGWEVPKRGDQVYAALVGMTAAVVSNLTEARWRTGIMATIHAAEEVADIACIAARTLFSPSVRDQGWAVPMEAAELRKGMGV